ncbi:hypothetical protein RUND412_011125, partial [Rhizina undulata]
MVADRAWVLITACSLMWTATTLAVAARLYTRKKITKEAFRPEDWLISAATVRVNWGLGKHSSDGPTTSDITTIGYASRPFYISAAGLTKISVL